MVRFNNGSTTTVHYISLMLKVVIIVAVCNLSDYVSAFECYHPLVLNRSKLSSAAGYSIGSKHPYSWSLLPPGPATTIPTTSSRIGREELSCYHRYRRNHQTKVSKTTTNLPSSSSSNIDFQSDNSLYGRGERHLSAILNEEDVVVYQTGSWEVDGVIVGDGDEDAPPMMQYCKVDTLQIIWTHNCEHGFIRGISVEIISGNSDGDYASEEQEDSNNSCRIVSCRTAPDDDLEFVEFGPEQLIARLPVEWLDENRERGHLVVPLPKELA